MEKQIITKLHKDFEDCAHSQDGVEFWYARELQILLGYDKWGNFEGVVEKAKIACERAKQKTSDHFADVGKTIQMPKNAEKIIPDIMLTRYACYLIAQNGDPKKEEIAMAQTYFAIQTRRQEIFDQLSDFDKRLFVRGEVSKHNKKLFSTAKKAGVTSFGSFNDAGYKGLYGMPLQEIESKKGIKKGELLDRAGTTELAANLFRITQTDDKLKKDKVKGSYNASQTHFMVGGKVRQTIKDIGGTMPEDLPVERHIKELKNEKRKLLASKKKK